MSAPRHTATIERFFGAVENTFGEGDLLPPPAQTRVMEPVGRLEVACMEELFEDVEIDTWSAHLAPPLPFPPGLPHLPLRGHGSGERFAPNGRGRSGVGGATSAGFSPCDGLSLMKEQVRDHTSSVASSSISAAIAAPRTAAGSCQCPGAGHRGGAAASCGSEGHWAGSCVPCKYLRSKRGCIKGEACELCHLSHPDVGYTGARRLMRALLAPARARRPPQDARALTAQRDGRSPR